MSMLRVGLSGCGAAGRAAVDAVRMHAHCDIVALHDPDPAALQRLGTSAGIPLRTTSFPELLGSGVDFVVLAGPCGVRRPQVEEAAAQGVHCLLHAPMAPDAATAAAMLAACDAAQVKLGVAVHGQQDPVFEQLRRMLAADWLGGPVIVLGFWGEDHLLETPPRPGDWRLDPALAGSEPMLQLAAHHVHLAAWLTGRRTLQVTAQSTRGFLPLPADGTAATAVLRGGVLCSFVASHLARASTFAVHGTDGGVRLAGDRVWLLGRSAFDGDVFSYPNAGEERTIARAELRGGAAAKAPDLELHGRFARWIDDLDDFPCPGEQAVQDQRVLDAIARAAASGRSEAP